MFKNVDDDRFPIIVKVCINGIFCARYEFFNNKAFRRYYLFWENCTKALRIVFDFCDNLLPFFRVIDSKNTNTQKTILWFNDKRKLDGRNVKFIKLCKADFFVVKMRIGLFQAFTEKNLVFENINLLYNV